MDIGPALPLNFQQKIRSEMTEILQLGYQDIMPAVVALRVTATGTGGPPATVTPAASSDIFRIPNTYNFLVWEIRGHIAMNSLSTETAVGQTGMLNTAGTRDRTIAKALNTKVSLFQPDKNDLRTIETNISNSTAAGPTLSLLSLAAIMPVAGGSPLRFIDQGYIFPLIIPANERIQMGIVFLNAAATTAQTEYGLDLIGAYVRTR